MTKETIKFILANLKDGVNFIRDTLHVKELSLREVISEIKSMQSEFINSKAAFLNKSNDYNGFILTIILLDEKNEFLTGLEIKCDSFDTELENHFGSSDSLMLK